MATLNEVKLIGFLGRDPEMFGQNGNKTVRLAVATSNRWKDKSTGEIREETEWHRVVLFRQLAEFAEKYLKKGNLVYVSGSLKTEKYKDKDGIDRYATNIVARSIQSLERTERGQQSATSSKENRKEPVVNEPLDMDDDIPF